VTLDVSTLRPLPAGFGQCGSCAYREASGRPEICYSCTLLAIKPAGADNTCRICDHPLHQDGTCHNPTCVRSDRFFKWNWAIGYRAGILQSRLGRYKFEGAKGWALIFGRILVGFLDDHRPSFKDFDLIVGSPSYTGPGAERNWDHIRLILEQAAEAGAGRWPFDLQSPAAIIKTKPTSPLRQAVRYQRRREIAEMEIRAALAVPDTIRIAGKKILIFDDVFTDGLTLNELARALRGVQASLVCGVSLARSTYQGPS
jgi:predicted amidophosphoribosyltransferase